jgi:ketosteroid isomerase-like protein
MSDAPDPLDAFQAAYRADREGFNPQDFDPLELSIAAMESFNGGDVESLLRQFDPDVEWWPLRSATEGPYRGHAGIRAWIEETSALFDFSRASIDAAEWRGGTILAAGELELRGRQSGAAIQTRVTWLLELKGDRVIWGRAFADRASALETLEERSSA